MFQQTQFLKMLSTETASAQHKMVLEPLGQQFSRKEVATHHTAQDCWVIVASIVYDISFFMDSHPGTFDHVFELSSV